MKVQVKLEDGTVVTGELVKQERVKVESAEMRWIGEITSWKGKQRQIVVDALRSEEKWWKLSEIVEIALEKELEAVGGVAESVKYHVGQLEKLGMVEFKK